MFYSRTIYFVNRSVLVYISLYVALNDMSFFYFYESYVRILDLTWSLYVVILRLLKITEYPFQ